MEAGLQTMLNQISSSPEPVVLATITGVKGSTPRKTGAKMLVLADGRTFGTIGGGCGEAEVRREALNVLFTGVSGKHLVNMTNDLAAEEGMVCGGIMEVFLDVLGEDKGLVAAYATALENREEPVLVTLSGSSDPVRAPIGSKLFRTVSGRAEGNLGLEPLNQAAWKLIEAAHLSGKTQEVGLAADYSETADEPAFQLLIEPNPLPPELVILGGGHIALPLATMANLVGYRVTVVDDRPSFANPQRFPQAEQVICQDFAAALAEMDITEHTEVVIVTRGHRHDKVCLEAVINRPAAYIGMIGSRRRVKALLSDLEDSGVSRERLDFVHTPIGLVIGAETPEEIAVSILAELIKCRRGGKSGCQKGCSA